MIHVCFSLNDKTGRYSKFTGTAMFSLLENLPATPKSITVHILHDNTLTADNRDKFSYVAGQYNQTVKFYNVEEICAEKITEYLKLMPQIKNARVGIAAFFRLLIPQIFPESIEKIIYLDSDIIVNMDITKLWQVDLGNKLLGAVPNVFQYKDRNIAFENIRILEMVKSGLVKFEDYFNSGVLLINVNALRDAQDLILEGILFRAKHPEYVLFDQAILNYCFSTNYFKLPVLFNQFVKDLRLDKATTIERKIYHYAGGQSGLGLDINDPFNRLWMDYFFRTPWLEASIIGNLYETVKQLDNDRMKSMLKFSAVMANKSRVFVVNLERLETIKKIFLVQDDEEVIMFEEEEPLQKIIDIMNTSKGKKIFFIILPYLSEKLAQAGFVEEKDFFNGFKFFSPRWQGLQNDYQLVQAM